MIEDGIKISELTTTSTINNEDLIPIVQNNETKSISFGNINKYSATEKVVGEWIDGKPLYRKVINFGSLPNNSQKFVNHNISNLGYISKLEGTALRTSDGVRFTIPHAGLSAPSSISLNGNATSLYIATGSDRTSIDVCYITIEYTKTTD